MSRRACPTGYRVQSILLFALVAFLPLAAAHAQSMDELFRNFNNQQDAGSYAEAERTARRMLQSSPTQGWQAASLNCLGRALNSQEKYTEAAAAYERGLQIPLETSNVNRGWIPNNLGNTYRHMKKYDDAVRTHRRALAAFEAIHGARSETAATVHSNLGWDYHDQEKYDLSADEHKIALSIRRALLGENNSDTGSSYNGLGSAYTDGGKLEEGRIALETALAIKERTDGPESSNTAVVVRNLAENASLQGQHDKADQYVRRAIAIREKVHGKNSKEVADTLEFLAKYQEKAGKADEAAATREQAKQMLDALAKGGASPDNPFRVGQRIQVTATQANVMDAGKPIGSVTKGMEFEVMHINGPWCAVKIKVGDDIKTGWLNSNQATLAAVAAAAAKPLELTHEVVSAEGGFKIKMPKQPTPAKQVVSGITHNAYTLELGKGTFVAGYFDLPGGIVLTFDAAIQAYTAARKGTVESEKRISLEDEFPGRDVLIKLPGGDYSRMQLYVVGSRQYQLIMEGTKEAVTSKLADDYFGSFERN